MKLMPIQDVLDQLDRVSRTLMEMERIYGSKYTEPINAIIDAKVYLRLFAQPGLEKFKDALENDPAVKFVPFPKLEPKEETPSK